MAIPEGYTVVDSGLIFCQVCYTLEGDLPLFFTADEELRKINEQSIWGAPLRRINRLVDKLVTIIQKGMGHAALDKNELQYEVDADERNF